MEDDALPSLLKVIYIGGFSTLIREFEEKSAYFELTVVENGLTAINKLQQNEDFDAIICEAYLPGMNGFDLAKMLKSKNLHISTPFILISPERDPVNKARAFKSSINDFYEYPVNVMSIHTRIGYIRKYNDFFALSHDAVRDDVHEYRVPWDKRLFDIVVSASALFLISPIVLVIMLAIRLESKGKVYYTSKRVGTGYRIFDFYKLRSMRVGADAALKDLKHLNQYSETVKPEQETEDCPRCALLPEGKTCSQELYAGGRKICEYWYYETRKNKASSTFIKIKDDPRVTKVGKFIRNTSIDELPQLINVLKGDMSIVGNRPLPLYEAEMLTSDDWSERFMGPAGITGLWQVEKRGKSGPMSEEERKALDNQYARTYSFWGDIKLILRTIPAVFQRENV
jgi:lipopolysaccharide/colanic/teichoic acid biosynthesis glycosyltransferase